MGEAAKFQIENDEAAQAAMKEKQVHAIPFVINPQAALSADKGEIVAEFEQEGFEVLDEVGQLLSTQSYYDSHETK